MPVSGGPGEDRQPPWPIWVARHFHAGPEDEPDLDANCDPSSSWGEEDDGEPTSFDEMSTRVGWDDPAFEPEDDDEEEC